MALGVSDPEVSLLSMSAYISIGGTLRGIGKGLFLNVWGFTVLISVWLLEVTVVFSLSMAAPAC